MNNQTINITKPDQWIIENAMKHFHLKTEKAVVERLLQLGIDQLGELQD
jgi:hypothetical protein